MDQIFGLNVRFMRKSRKIAKSDRNIRFSASWPIVCPISTLSDHKIRHKIRQKFLIPWNKHILDLNCQFLTKTENF